MKKKKIDKKTLIIILSLLIGIVALWRVHQMMQKPRSAPPVKPAEAPAEQRVPVNVYKVSRNNFKDTLLVLGKVQGGTEVEMRFETEGKIKQFRFKEGDKVEKDEIIAQIEQNDALLKMKQAQNDYEQHKQLYEAGAIIPLKLEQVRNVYEQAKLELEKTNLRASRTGLIANKEVEVGEFVTPNTKIAKLIDMENVIVVVDVIEKDINKLIIGQSAKLNFDAYKDFDFFGKVYEIRPSLNQQMPMLEVKIRMENPDALILPGMFARALIYVYEEENAMVIPLSAVDKSAQETRVFVVGERNRVAGRVITVSYSSSDYAVVTQGLSEGDMVVADKPESLQDGAEIEIIEMKEFQAGK